MGIKQTDIVVIGGGPGGYTAAFYAASKGRKVVLVEKEARLGGVCLNRGCIPSKALLHAAEIMLSAKEAEKFGISFPAPSVDLSKLRAWKAGVVEKLGQGIKNLSGRRGVEVIQGEVSFQDSRTVKVGNELIHFEHANVVHMGDLIFNRRFPYIDTGAGAHIGSWIKVLQKTQTYFNRETQFIFGHALDPEAVTGGMDDIKAMEHYLVSLLKFVETKMKAGTVKEELYKITAIPGAEEWQGGGIERSIDAAWLELSGENPL